MASPQKENGHTGIANEILEHIIHPGINGSELKLLLFVIRKTYGYNKRADRIPLSQFQKGLLTKRSNVCRTIKSLVAKRLLCKDKSIYKFNKNWEEWVVAKRLPSSQKDNRVVAKRLHSKESISKESIHDFSKKNREPKKMDYELITDDDVTPTGEVKRRQAKNDGYKGHLTNPILQWAEERMGHKFTTPLKQKKAISKMLYAGYKPNQIKQCWEELEDDEFWNDKGIDFMTVLNQISKSKVKKESLEEKLWRI